jgi:hypothetical protein
MRTRGRKIEVVVTDKLPEGFVDDSERWENGELGQSEEHAKPAPRKVSNAIDNALVLVPIFCLSSCQ